MNLWECDFILPNGKRCDARAVGVGGAVGLRAIGWYFEIGPRLRCPEHRPDGVPCHDGPHTVPSCGPCRADEDAKRWQSLIIWEEMPEHHRGWLSGTTTDPQAEFELVDQGFLRWDRELQRSVLSHLGEEVVENVRALGRLA